MNINFPADIMCRGQEISAMLILRFDLLICPILFQSLFLLFWLISVLSLLQKEKCSNSYFGMVQYKIYDEVTRISIITDWHSENSRKIWGIGIWMSQSFMYVWMFSNLSPLNDQLIVVNLCNMLQSLLLHLMVFISTISFQNRHFWWF